MPVDGQHPGAERLQPARVSGDVPAEVGLSTLAEPVDVGDRDQVGQPVVGRLVEGFPDGALGELAVPAQYPDAVGQPLQVLACQRDAHAVGQSLAQRAGGNVDPGQLGRGMAFKPLAEAPVAVHQLVVGDDAHGLEHRVQQRGCVALGKDQVVIGRQVRLIPVVAQVPRDEHRQQVRRGHARGRMTGTGRGGGADRVHAQLRGQFRNGVEADHGVISPGSRCGRRCAGERPPTRRRCRLHHGRPPRRRRVAPRGIRYCALRHMVDSRRRGRTRRTP